MKKLIFLVTLILTTAQTQGMAQRLSEPLVRATSTSRLLGLGSIALTYFVFSPDIHRYANAKAELMEAQAAKIRSELPK